MRRLAVPLSLFAIVVLGTAAVAGWLLVRASRRSRAPQIVVPVYPEPSDNRFADLTAAAATLHADEAAIVAAFEAPWNADDPRATELLRRHAKALRQAHEALQGDCLQPRPSSLDEEYPWLRDFRYLTRLFVVKGREAERRGRPDEALGGFGDALSLATVAARNGAFLHGVFGFLLTAQAAPDLERCLASRRVSAHRLRAFLPFTEKGWQGRVPYPDTLAIEWEFTLRTLDDMAAGRVDLIGPPAQPAPGKPVPRLVRWALYDTARAEITQKLGRAIEDSRRPYYLRTYQMPPPKSLLAGMLLVDAPRSGAKEAERDTLLQGLRALTAIELSRHESGRLPRSLRELVPRYLSDIPLDPFDGQPLRYRVTGSTYRLYSIGPDRKDDGGTARFDPQAHSGDLLLIPPGPLHRPRRS